MLKTVKFATTSTIHFADANGTVCGSEVGRNAGSCVTQIRKFTEVQGEVSCKRCVKLAADRPAEVETAAPAPKPGQSVEWTCPACAVVRSTWPSDRALRLHARVCKGDVQARALRMVENFAELAESAETTAQYAAATRRQLEAEALATTAQATYAQIVAARRAGVRAAIAS